MDEWASDWAVGMHLTALGLPDDPVLVGTVQDTVELANNRMWGATIRLPDGYRHAEHGEEAPVWALVEDLQLSKFILPDPAFRPLRAQQYAADQRWEAHRRMHGLNPDPWDHYGDYVPLPCSGSMSTCPYFHVTEQIAAA